MAQMIGGNTVNWKQQEVPYSRFGTRKIVWFNIGRLDTRDDANLDMEQFNRVIEIIQTKGEIVTIGAPRIGEDYGRVIVGIFEDTFNNGGDTDDYYTNNKSETLEQALENATDGNVTVQQIYMYGGPGAGGTGWETDSDYREYDRKSDFLNGYTRD
jgi:hypothetical protein